MTQQDKDLLLKVLCDGLSCGIICNDNRHGSSRVTNIDITPDDIEHKNPEVVLYYFDFDECGRLENCKPYLRNMEDMTNEEKIELNNIPVTRNYLIVKNDLPWELSNYNQVDWLNKNHFNWRKLPKDLYIKVTEENNPY